MACQMFDLRAECEQKQHAAAQKEDALLARLATAAANERSTAQEMESHIASKDAAEQMLAKREVELAAELEQAKAGLRKASAAADAEQTRLRKEFDACVQELRSNKAELARYKASLW